MNAELKSRILSEISVISDAHGYKSFEPETLLSQDAVIFPIAAKDGGNTHKGFVAISGLEEFRNTAGGLLELSRFRANEVCQQIASQDDSAGTAK